MLGCSILILRNQIIEGTVNIINQLISSCDIHNVESLMIIRDFGVQTRIKYVYGAERVRVLSMLHFPITFICVVY